MQSPWFVRIRSRMLDGRALTPYNAMTVTELFNDASQICFDLPQAISRLLERGCLGHDGNRCRLRATTPILRARRQRILQLT